MHVPYFNFVPLSIVIRDAFCRVLIPVFFLIVYVNGGAKYLSTLNVVIANISAILW